MIALPRIYLGLHYPTDILVGALIGIVSVCVVNGTKIRHAIGLPILKFSEKYPGLFYACFFLLCFQLASLFDDLRALGSWALVIFDYIQPIANPPPLP